MRILRADEAVLYSDCDGNSHTDLVLKILDYKVIIPYINCKKHRGEVIKT